MLTLKKTLIHILLLMSLQTASVVAQVIPPNVDAGRIKLPEKPLSLEDIKDRQQPLSLGYTPGLPIPDNAKDVFLTVKDFKVTGSTVFSKQDISAIYGKYLNKEISLKTVYKIADKITKRYHDEGYFLSIAFLPEQNITDGVVNLHIYEGYIARVELPTNIPQHRIIKSHINHLLEQKPLKTKELESFLLRLNDLPGYVINGTLVPLDETKDGSVKLMLTATDKKGKGQISFDNFSSRFLGINEVSAAYSKSFIPLHQTTLSAINSIPTDRLSHIALGHKIAFVPNVDLDFNGSFTKASPGFNLERFDIDNESLFFSTGVNYQWIRQREENLALSFSVDARNTDSDILGNALTRDRIRAFRIGARYDYMDSLQGYNVGNITLSQGFGGFGANKKGDNNLSRAEANPSFNKAELSITRLQTISDDWYVLMTTDSQIASGPLFSAEEFGYGGQSFGRAFDASEIVGDNGISASFELRYNGITRLNPVGIQPYVFYDIARVWNFDTAQTKTESGSSVGLGMRAITEYGFNANLTLALPLIRDRETPIYGQDEKAPRVLFQLVKTF